MEQDRVDRKTVQDRMPYSVGNRTEYLQSNLEGNTITTLKPQVFLPKIKHNKIKQNLFLFLFQLYFT